MQKKLSDFCTEQLKSRKLVTSTFTHEFNLRQSIRQSTKNFNRLSKILSRAIVKEAPYLEHILVENTSNILSSSSAGLLMKGIVYTSYRATIIRYVTYLNYLCIKQKFPASIHVAFVQLGDDLSSVCLTFSQSVWVPSTTVSRTNKAILQAAIQAMADIAREQGLDGNSIFRSQVRPGSVLPHWSAIPSDNWCVEAAKNLGKEDICFERAAFEKIFLHIDNIIRVLMNFTRTFAYASNAFSPPCEPGPDSESGDSEES